MARDDISVDLAGQELATSGEFLASSSGTHGRALRRSPKEVSPGRRRPGQMMRAPVL